MAQWTSDSNRALTLSLVRGNEDKKALSDGESYEGFHPTFTYPIYGEDEKIYGYKDLTIDLRFSSGSLVHYLSVTYSAKLPSSSTVDDVEGTLASFIPPGYYTDEAAFQSRVEEDAMSFKPCGELVHTYTRKGKGVARDGDSSREDVVTFEVYHSTWLTPGFKEYHSRMQLFILLYIEAGSYIDEHEDPWEFFVLYEKRKRQNSDTASYHFVGYSSLYNFYHFPEKVRMRLSQFVILSPYQRNAHGSALYNAIYAHVVSRPDVAELTVEDPAEAFEDLRDVNDLRLLMNNTKFLAEAFGADSHLHSGGKVPRKVVGKRSGKLIPPADKGWMEKWRVQLKIAGRQFHRLVEMLVLNHIDLLDARMMRAYRLQVKERLYRFNFEILVQLDKEERLQKLEETFQSVKDDYMRILAVARI